MLRAMSRRVRRLLFLLADTGGGHRSPATAVARALRERHGGRVQVKLVDVLADYAPWPLNRLSDIYPYAVRLRGWPWALGYRLSDGPRRVALITRCCWPLARAALSRLLHDYSADAVLSCHPILNHLTRRALAEGAASKPLITLVVDLIDAHPFWFAPGVSRYLVPTEMARRRALACGLPEGRVCVTGLPVRASFARITREPPSAVKLRLGLEVDLPLVLLVNGAEGMGESLYRLCESIANSGARVQLAAIAGRNEQVQAQVAAAEWPLPTRSEGFVDNMHEWMRAADLLVTRASPSTISEAAVIGLPMVLSSALPGQERPNVSYVVQAGAGVWAPKPEQMATAVRELLSSEKSRLAQMAARARTLAQPGAAQRVAEIVWAAANGELA